MFILTEKDSVNLRAVLRRIPDASAEINGSFDNPEIYGTVHFYQTPRGVIAAAEIRGLPAPPGQCAGPIFGFHIHEGSSCTGNEQDPFAEAKTHYDPHGCPHPHHSGDLPPLFGSGGYALSLFLTDRFTVSGIIGRTVVVHSSPDDFTTQPAGNSGTKIACGEIKAYRKHT